MIRTLFLLLAWFVAVPVFSQGKPASPSTQEQLLELRLEQQHLKEKLDDQKASLEEKFEVRKENLEYQREETNDWITLFGLVVTVIGIGLPVIGFFIGKRIVMDIERQKVGMVSEQEELKSQITKKQEEVDKKHQEQLVWMEKMRLDAEITFNRYREEIERLLKKATEGVDKIGVCVNDAEGKIKRMDATFFGLDALEGQHYQKGSDQKGLEIQTETASCNDATPLEKEIAKALKLYSEGKHEQSINLHLSILELYNSELAENQKLNIYFNLSYSYALTGNDENVIKYSQWVLNLDPNFYFAWYNMGYSYFRKGNNESAIYNYKKALEINPNLYEAWNGIGNVFLKEKKYKDAAEIFEKTVVIEPSKVEVWNSLGAAYGYNGNKIDAIRCYEKALELNPKEAGIINNIGIVYSELGRYTDAISYYKNALEINPDFKEPWFNMGVAYQTNGLFRDAINCYDKAIEIDPCYFDALMNIGVVYVEGGRLDGKYEKSIEYYLRALEIVPDNEDLICNLAVVYDESEDYDNAIKYYKKSNKIASLFGLTERLITQNRENREIEDALIKLRKSTKTELDWFGYSLLNTIYKKKNGVYHDTTVDTFKQLQQTVGGDASKVAWNFKQTNDWLAREAANPTTLDKEAREFITELIRRIEEWRGR